MAKKDMNKTQKPGKNTEVRAGAQSAAAEQKKKKHTGTELFMIIFAAVALIAIVASIIIGVILNNRSKYRVDYLSDDLSKLVSIAESDYKGITVNIAGVDPVQDFDVDDAIIRLLRSKKDKTAKYEGIYLKNQTVTVGDIVNLFYRGYTLDAEGNKVDFDGGCNFSGEAAALEIGSGQFVPRFEYGLIGAARPNYSEFKRIDSVGTIGESDRIFIRYERELNDGTTMAAKYELVDLSLGREALDAKYGTGFWFNLLGSPDSDPVVPAKQYGSKFNFTVETDNGVEKFNNVTVYRTTSAGDLIQLTYSAYNFDGTVVQAQSKVIDLSDEKLDEIYGTGFRAYFEAGVPVGIKAVNSAGKADFFNTDVKDGKNSYFDITVQYVYEVGDDPLTVEAYFPIDYQSEDLRGVTAYFDVYIQSVQVYDAPEYNEEFITETLGLSAEDLAEYEGETLVEKHTAKLRAELEEAYEKSVRSATVSTLWDIYLSKASFGTLPENEVRDFYDTYYDDVSTNYAYYSSSYDSIDAFAREYLGLSSNADWKAKLTEFAEDAVKQKLVFYYIIREEGFVMTEEAYPAIRQRIYDDLFESYLESVNFSRDNYEKEEDYEKMLATHKSSFETKYDEEYYRETALYEYAFDRLIEIITVTTVLDK